MQALPEALRPLSAWHQWMVYVVVPRGDGKADKFPANWRTGEVTDAHNPDAWTDHLTALAAAGWLGEQYGPAFVLTQADPFFFLDIDGCYDNGQWSPLAQSLVDRFAGAAVEVSYSGRGLHIIGAHAGGIPHGCKNGAQGIELYTSGRFIALTGTHAAGRADAQCDAAFAQTVIEYFPPAASMPGTVDESWTDGPREGYGGPTDDDELIAKARTSTSASTVFGQRASFAALWDADPDALSRAYPDNYGSRPYDASSADAGLAAHLAFWTGADCERIERLMWRSGLAREKWTQHRTYLRMTIAKAAARCTDVYRGGSSPTPPAQQQQPQEVGESLQLTPTPQIAESYQYLSAHQQIEYFAGCVYVQDMHRVYTPRGSLLKPEQFRATYSGYIFALDATNDKTTKNAWEAFVESQAVRYPMAEGVTFRPERPPGELVEEENTMYVNTYAPAGVRMHDGDPRPFIDHLYKMLPDERDAEIVLAYMAACVQYQGHKFQWAPLIQGVEGNGKTMLSYCTAYACGYKYSHFPKASEVGSKHNTWLMRRVFIGIEDVYYPEHRREIIEDLKPLITNEVLPIEPKTVDQFSTRVCANFILNSNHKDALRKTKNDRRFAPFYTAQQSRDDLTRDGMDGDYFPDLYDWLKGTGRYVGRPTGYSIVAHYLATYPIPDELNPARAMHRAPLTSTTAEAIEASAGRVEQEIQEAIGEGRIGFAGGWISSMALDRLLDTMRMSRAIGQRRRREMLQEIGYDWHPALPNGRTNNTVSIDGGKPRLFIHHDHPDRSITSPAEAVEAYVAAQNGQSSGSAAARAFSAGN